MTTRVLRLLEYEYVDQAAADDDLARWEVQGTRRFNQRMVVRSTVLTGYPRQVDEPGSDTA